ncbi:NrfD/PsrC family molybdoenzyme membrane anchor subunit [Meiothermus sp.]|uniref:NrfD/PsrC family molybdoenzyme membrane anchor subunit n=1 Tax=Meiothermus sp. TaxID=1955249 RepID=UPI0021DC2AD9|nr:NrfD/PsrC family molybdoenzyme membrane anchor subunit [Meiothermus sp.]GIW33175.1 MAG: polysulfide reductase [Meiothermus sp.]
MSRTVGWILFAILALVGVVGVFLRFTSSRDLAAYGSYIPWGLWVATYIFFAGLSAGAFVVAVLGHVFGVERLRPIAPLALAIALACLGAALVTVWFDLGHMERVFNVFLRPHFSSMMAWMVWLYTAYAIATVLVLYGLWRGLPSLTRIALMVGTPLVVFYPGAAGALFGTVVAQSLWHSPVFPILFLFGGVLSGIALVTFATVFFSRKDKDYADRVWLLGRIMLGLLLMYLLIEWAEYSIPMWYQVGHEFEALMGVLFGPYWFVFWIFHLLLGMIIPILLLALSPRNPLAVGIAGLLASSMFLSVRLNLVIPSQVQPQLEGLVNAYRDRRLSYTYLPTLFEWSVVAFSVALAIAIAYGVVWFLNREKKLEVIE